MITQTLKSWFRTLFSFAWWPWKRSSQIGYTSPARCGNCNTVQGTLRGTAIEDTDSTLSWSEGISIAVEQETLDNDIDESSEIADHESPPWLSLSHATNRLPPPSFTTTHDSATSSETSEKHLEFLQYLVKQRVFNEGFPAGQEPKQYTRG